MRDGADKLARRIARQLRIRIKGDHIFDVRKGSRLTDDKQEIFLRAGAQKRIQISKLAPFALVTHPKALLRVPTAWTMKQKEHVVVRVVPGSVTCTSVLVV